MPPPAPPPSFPLNRNTTIRVLLVAFACLLVSTLPSSAQTSIPVYNNLFQTYSTYWYTAHNPNYINQLGDTPDGYSPFPVVDVKGG